MSAWEAHDQYFGTMRNLGRRLSQLLAGLLLGLLWLYRRIVSPWLGPRCRFEPSCSAYAEEALRVHGPAKGLRLAVWRLLRCQPFARGGIDAVPGPR